MKKERIVLLTIGISVLLLIISIITIYINLSKYIERNYSYTTYEKDGYITAGTIVNNDVNDLYMPSNINAISFNWKNDSVMNIYFEGTLEQWCNIDFNSNYSENKLESSFQHLFLKDTNNKWYELTDVVIPTSITSIKNDIFSNLINISSVVIHENVIEIESYAFANCKNIKSITIPSSVKSIGTAAFKGCSKLTDLNLSEGLKNIHSYAFSDCTTIKNITIPNTVTWTNDSIFLGCTSLENIILSNNLDRISENFFENCSSLKEIILPESVERICLYAFKECISLKKIEFPNSIQAIGEYAFENCINLEQVILNNPNTKIYPNSFLGNNKIFTLKNGSYYLAYDNNPFHFLYSPLIPENEYTIIEGNTKCININAIKDYIYYDKIFYMGSKEEWDNILIYGVLSNDIYFYSDIEPTNNDNYWHYDNNNNPIIW